MYLVKGGRSFLLLPLCLTTSRDQRTLKKIFLCQCKRGLIKKSDRTWLREPLPEGYVIKCEFLPKKKWPKASKMLRLEGKTSIRGENFMGQLII